MTEDPTQWTGEFRELTAVAKTLSEVAGQTVEYQHLYFWVRSNHVAKKKVGRRLYVRMSDMKSFPVTITIGRLAELTQAAKRGARTANVEEAYEAVVQTFAPDVLERMVAEAVNKRVAEEMARTGSLFKSSEGIEEIKYLSGGNVLTQNKADQHEDSDNATEAKENAE